VIGFNWENELAPRGIPFLDVDQHEDVRRKSAKFKARLYFCEGAEEFAFTRKWKEWLPAIKTGDPDRLVHPLLGPVDARVATVGGEVRAQVRDGIIIDVEWTETLLDSSSKSADLSTDIDLQTECQLADQNCSDVGVNYPSGQSTTSLSGAFQSIRGSIFSLTQTVEGAINTMVGNVDQMLRDLDLKNDHTTWPARDALINVWTGLQAYKKAARAAARPTATTTLKGDTSLDAFALAVNNDLYSVMGLNPSAIRDPLVKKGTTLTYFTR